MSVMFKEGDPLQERHVLLSVNDAIHKDQFGNPPWVTQPFYLVHGYHFLTEMHNESDNCYTVIGMHYYE